MSKYFCVLIFTVSILANFDCYGQADFSNLYNPDLSKSPVQIKDPVLPNQKKYDYKSTNDSDYADSALKKLHNLLHKNEDQNIELTETVSTNSDQNNQNTINQNLQPIAYDSKKVNAERFYKSPCFALLGFNPLGDIEQQEKNYKICEDGKQDDQIRKVIIIVVISIMIIALFFFLVSRFSNKTNEDSKKGEDQKEESIFINEFAKAFTIEQKGAIISLLHLLNSSNVNSDVKTIQYISTISKLLLPVGNLQNLPPQSTLIGMVNIINVISKEQKEWLVMVVHELMSLNNDNYKNSFPLIINFFDNIGIKPEEYMELSKKANTYADYFNTN